MKFIFRPVCLLLFCLVHTAGITQGSWEKIQVPTTKSLNAVFFTDSLHGWVGGDSGTIIHTTDGGKSWITQETHALNHVTALFFLNRNLGWAASLNYSVQPYGTVLLKTTNGGADWTPSPYPANDIFINCILYLDSLRGWMGGSPHALVKTLDGGQTWAQAKIDTSVLAFFPVLGITFYNEKYGYACGGMFDIAGVIWRTSNGGDSWSAIDNSMAPADEVHELYTFDSINVIGAGGDPDFGYGVGMIRTADGGVNWTYHELGMQGNAYNLDFRTGAEAWAPLGPKRSMIYTLDTCKTWTEIPTPGITAINNMTFPDSLHGFAVGQQGAFIKYRPTPAGIVGPHDSPGPAEVILQQNVPNPFVSETKIRAEFAAASQAKAAVIKVFNCLGAEVLSVDCIEQGGSACEATLDASGLEPGMYYYRLYISGKEPSAVKSYARKMVVSR